MKLYERIENNNFDEIDRNRAIELIEGGNGHLVYNENYFKLQKKNEKLKNIRYDTPYGTETIHLIPESNLIEINTHKYMIEVEPGKFVDLKQVYLENKKLNEYKENYIPIQKVKDKIEELDERIKYEENEKVVIYLHKQRKVLKELLESEDK